MSYDPAKRKLNLRKHGIDLAECEVVFDAPMLTREDDREAYGEQRLISLAWLKDRGEDEPHLISCRDGETHEQEAYFSAFTKT